jgi:hypothetical protein
VVHSEEATSALRRLVTVQGSPGQHDLERSPAKVTPMPLPQPLILAVAAMIGLAVLRVIRTRLGREPHPDGKARFPFILAFLLVPPVVLGALFQSGGGQFGGMSWLPLYVAGVAALAILMSIAAMIVRVVVPVRLRPLLLMALNGSKDTPAKRVDPPLTARLTASRTLVDAANAVFPSGASFPTHIERADFRRSWDSLDDATRVLETQIAEDETLGIGAASAATATADNARSRLETLRRLAAESGQAWAAV